jgi:hypothetical protein
MGKQHGEQAVRTAWRIVKDRVGAEMVREGLHSFLGPAYGADIRRGGTA